MACKKGCSACCYVSISVFESEAQRILDWALALSSASKQELANLLKHKAEKGAEDWGKDAAGQKRKACAALVDGACSIYEARPVICRTQGAPLQWKTVNEKNEVSLYRDHCSLNFKDKSRMPKDPEFLDLDKLTALQSIAHINWKALHEKNSNDTATKRQSPHWNVSKDSRIELSEIIETIKKSLT
jgi:Fe-S-cluster containining protein